MVCTWFGELCFCSCLPVLPCSAWVLLSYVLQAIFLYPVFIKEEGGTGNYGGLIHPVSIVLGVAFGAITWEH